MEVIDLCSAFVAIRSSNQCLKNYEALYPELFNHYFEFWCPRDYQYVNLEIVEIGRRIALLKSAILETDYSLLANGLDSSSIKIVAFVGGNTSNGHAYLEYGEPVVWLPIETYATDNRARVFVRHEIIHALHYRSVPQFCFFDHQSKHDIGRQLITEGVATLLTALTLGISDNEALWSDYMFASEANLWSEECHCQRRRLADWFCSHFHDSLNNTKLFQADDSSDIWKFRAGYHLGLQVVRKIALERSCTAHDLLKLPREEFEAHALEVLNRLRSGE